MRTLAILAKWPVPTIESLRKLLRGGNAVGKRLHQRRHDGFTKRHES